MLLERTSAPAIRETKARMRAVLDWHFRFYSELENQRRAIEPELEAALSRSAQHDFDFDHWQRAVKYRYALEPLSTLGSLVNPVGGRFNIGAIAPQRFPSFSALYLTEDKDTALQEALGQERVAGIALTPQELALANPQSTTIVSVSGHLESIVDLRKPSRLAPFVRLIADFEFSTSLRKDARHLGCTYRQVRTVADLVEVLLDPNWRASGMAFDIPSASQIFGRLVMQAGVEGIVFPSKQNRRPCLAVFPRNLGGATSFVEIDDEPPPGCAMTRLDGTNWRQCEASPKSVGAK